MYLSDVEQKNRDMGLEGNPPVGGSHVGDSQMEDNQMEDTLKVDSLELGDKHLEGIDLVDSGHGVQKALYHHAHHACLYHLPLSSNLNLRYHLSERPQNHIKKQEQTMLIELQDFGQ